MTVLLDRSHARSTFTSSLSWITFLSTIVSVGVVVGSDSLFLKQVDHFIGLGGVQTTRRVRGVVVYEI